MTTPTADFDSALRGYIDAAKNRAVPDIINAESENITRATLRLMPKANRGAITAKLGTPSRPSALAMKIVWKRLGKGGTRAQARALAKRMIAARLRSVGYIKSGQIPVLKALGARTGSGPNPRSNAARGGATKARAGNPTATLENAATGAATVGAPARDAALSERASRLTASATRRMQQEADRFAGKA